MKKIKILTLILVPLIVLIGCSSRKDLVERFPAKFKGFYKLTKYVLTPEEFDEFLALPEPEQEQYILDFWEKTNPFPDTLNNEFRDLLIERTKEADEKFKFAKTMGSDTDRGRIYVMYGPPDDIETRDYDKEYDDDISEMSTRRETDADIAGDYRKQKNYEYWTYENTFGLKPNTVITFVDDYSSNQYKLLSNLLTYQDKNIPNPLRLYLSEEGKALYQQNYAAKDTSLIQKIDEKRPIAINLDYIAYPLSKGQIDLMVLIYLPLKNLVFIENDLGQSSSIVEVEANFKEKGNMYSRTYTEEITVKQKSLMKYASSGSYLMVIGFMIPMDTYSVSIKIKDLRSGSEGSSTVNIIPITAIRADKINMFCSKILLSSENEERIFAKKDNKLLLDGKAFRPVFGSVYSKTDQLYLYMTAFMDCSNPPDSLDITIQLLSSETGNELSAVSYKAGITNNKLVVSRSLDVSGITTGQYEIRILHGNEILQSRNFYFLR